MQRLGSAGINGVERIFTTTIYDSIAVWHLDAFERGVESVQIFCLDLMANTVNMKTNHHNMKQKHHNIITETAQPLKSDIRVTSRIGGLV